MENREIDLGVTIIPKSDQLNADDLIAGSKTIHIRDMKQIESDTQPISIYFDGDNNKPYKPNKGMRRLLVQLWGTNGSQFVGRYLTIMRDESVTWAGAEVGGIVISHASHIEAPRKVSVTIGRGKKKSLTILPLNYVQPNYDAAIAKLNACKSLDELGLAWSSLTVEEKKAQNVIEAKDKLKTTLK